MALATPTSPSSPRCGFLLKEGRRAFKVFDTLLVEVDYVFEKTKGKRQGRFEKVDLEAEDVLMQMASEERRYKAASRGGKGPDEERAQRLVFALPSVNRVWHRSWRAEWEGEKKRADALSRLVDLGTAAVPALAPR